VSFESAGRRTAPVLIAVVAALVAALAASLAAPGQASAAPATSSKKKAAPKKKEPKVTKPRDYARTTAVIKTSQGDVTVRFFFDKAPAHVKNFVDLCASGFYDGTLFHRVIPAFMVQGGDPLTKNPKTNPKLYGTGGNVDAKGNEIKVKAEFNDVSHRRGILSMARATDPDSASSQFFVVVKDSPFLDRQYTAFGEVTKGMEVVDSIVTASDSDRSDPDTGGRPRKYQKIVKVELVEEPPAAPAAR